MISLHTNRNDDEEVEEEDAEGVAGLDDAILDEITDDAPVEEPEGFGHIKEDIGEVEEEEEEEKTDEELEEDAEDVDYDSFDDEDHF